MIYGIGVDIVDIERMNDSHMTPFVINRLFHPVEIENIPQQGKEAYLASRFAAKEAFVKALHTGFRKIAPRDICVVNDELGRPHYIFSDNVKDLLPKNLTSIHLSISHEKHIAIAYTVIEASM
ncbi:MAG: holo-[acyl-carrier-protein] synthase [Spirochaetia bacterium]|nr:holo-[acyl-carrier-protein] synthase [Spirochaetia bacterium]